uniref:Nicotinamide N-methyltransferase-like protein n=1 Tax=Pyxicephalus adspersus TaxID=30357 RepID=A0AAV2ZYT4_PYXAD|nr:TPA: hypothetical protein GDO54_003961 [Pyxicephalus adspersus]
MFVSSESLTLGEFKGNVLIDFSIGPVIHHLYPACEYFRDIILLRVSDHCILEVKKWLNARTGAFDWSHTATIALEIGGNSNPYEDNETQLKASITNVVKCDLSKENLIDPLILQQADCVVTACMLEVISKDQEDFVRNLRKLSQLLKCGGHIMIYCFLNATYFMVQGEKFHFFKINEHILRSELVNEGFVIKHWEVFQRTAKSHLTDYDSVVFCTAIKEK